MTPLRFYCSLIPSNGVRFVSMDGAGFSSSRYPAPTPFVKHLTLPRDYIIRDVGLSFWSRGSRVCTVNGYALDICIEDADATALEAAPGDDRKRARVMLPVPAMDRLSMTLRRTQGDGSSNWREAHIALIIEMAGGL